MMIRSSISNLLISHDTSIREAVAVIDQGGKQIVLVVDEKRQLIGTVTDGDIRREILKGRSLDRPVNELLSLKAGSDYPKPVTTHIGATEAELIQLFKKNVINHLPIIDGDGCVVDLVTLDDVLPGQLLPLQAVIMSGGCGTRLRPLTEELPKPMLPVGDRPLLELTIERLRQAGIRRVHLTTHYKGEVIEQYFKDGRNFGVEIQYVKETMPLGTAGGLGLIGATDEPLLVINGDVLTHIDFRSMLNFHRENHGHMTVAVKKYEFRVPYGAIETDEELVTNLIEKPVYSLFVNAGIYLLEPVIQEYITKHRHIDMTDLIKLVLSDGRRVVSFPILEYWLDIGNHSDYDRAQEDERKRAFYP